MTTTTKESMHLPAPVPWAYRLTDNAFDLVTPLMGGFHYSGGGNLPQTPESYVLAANHDNMFETTLGPKGVREETGEDVYTPAKHKFWKIPVAGGAIGSVLESVGAFPVVRSLDISAQPEVAEKIEYLIENRAILLWFPQMTRKNHKKGEVSVRSLKASSMLVIAKHNLEIVPTGTDGKVFPYTHFGEPFKINAPPFDITTKDELIAVHQDILKPMIKDELQPRMQDAANEARYRRRDLIVNSIPRQMLWKLYHPLGGGDLHLDFGVAASR